MQPFDFSPLVLSEFEPCHRWPIIGLIAGCYIEYQQVIELDTLDADLLAIPASYPGPLSVFRVLAGAGGVAGTVAVKGGSNGRCELKRLFLDRTLRGQRLGRRLVEWSFAWSRDQGYPVMDIWTDVLFETAHRLYRGLGATETGAQRDLGGRNAVRETHFVMELWEVSNPG